MGKKLFDYVIGNPPYQDETLGDNKGFAPPVYNKFLDCAYEC
ncbi:Eco57I restriction-modification methylase domain-containing protein [Bacillota bacterium HCP3S3_F1_1]